MLSGMTPLDAQVTYYRRRAAEYDATSYRNLSTARARIAAQAGRFGPLGDLLEIACGTGMWTEHLASAAWSVTAIDAAPEMLALARQRVRRGPVTFQAADVFGWTPPRSFDTVFFAFWLSHVPASAFARFWSVVRDALADSGRVLFVDDLPAAADRETYLAGSREVVERRLTDGTRHTLVKVVRTPAGLVRELAGLGWHADVNESGHGWLVGEARV
jgi:SAM-dependent methyltransferase